jgi:transcriptional antiterminator NusG
MKVGVVSLSDEAKWYVVHTYSGYENKVASNLEKTVENRHLSDLIQQIFVPTEKVTEIKDEKKREVERKIFPGYVLIKMILTDESWYVVRNIRGCTGFVGPSSKPLPLTDEEVARLGVEKKEVEVSYGVGDSVKIIGGPLEGFVGIVKSVDKEKDRACVTVSMFGRETPVELELNQAEAVE